VLILSFKYLTAFATKNINKYIAGNVWISYCDKICMKKSYFYVVFIFM
jgi:hypothetical protein